MTDVGAPEPNDRPLVLTDLIEKYELLVKLRREQAGSSAEQVRPTLRAVSRRFPGSLRELDCLAPGELENRGEACRQAAADARHAEPWMSWMLAYHDFVRHALRIKRRSGRARPLTDPQAQELAAAAPGPILWKVELVRRVVSPSTGRINAVAFDEVARHFGVTAERVRNSLFPHAGRTDDEP